MKKSKNAIVKGIEKFYLKEIAPLDDAFMLAAPIAILKLRKFVAAKEADLEDIRDDDGLYDVDAIIADYKNLVANAPNGYMEVKGIKLYPKDFDILARLINAEEN